MSYSQEIYDAVRSRISGGNVADAVRDVAFQAFDIGHAKGMLHDQIAAVGYEMCRPSVLYRPTVILDGDHYCALYGDDLMNGCAGFGRTMGEAMTDFDTNWTRQQAPHVRQPA